MALANISLTDSFTTQFIRLNQALIVINALLSGQSNLDGSLVLTNSAKLSGNVTINVAMGLIKGDGGLVSNLQPSFLTQNSVGIVSNTSLISISSNNVALGGKTYLNVNPATGVTDNSSSNVATANIVNQAYQVTTGAFAAANASSNLAVAAFNQANGSITVLGVAQAAFSQANTATTSAAQALNVAVEPSLPQTLVLLHKPHSDKPILLMLLLNPLIVKQILLYKIIQQL